MCAFCKVCFLQLQAIFYVLLCGRNANECTPRFPPSTTPGCDLPPVFEKNLAVYAVRLNPRILTYIFFFTFICVSERDIFCILKSKWGPLSRTSTSRTHDDSASLPFPLPFSLPVLTEVHLQARGLRRKVPPSLPRPCPPAFWPVSVFQVLRVC